MPRGGARANTGGARENAGRPMTDLRSLPIRDDKKKFGVPVEWHAEGLTITQCGECGAMSWEPYNVTVTAIEPLPQPDSNGYHFPTLATIERPGRVAKHKRDCINK